MIILKKYLIVCDLDGTLLNKKHDLSKRTIRYIKKLIKQGHIFVINTGRPYQGMLRFKNKLDIDCPYICDNGSSIYWDSNKDFPVFNKIDKNEVKNFLKELHPYIYSTLLSSHQKLYFINRNKIPRWMIHINEETQVIELDNLDNIDEDITLMSIYIHEEDRSKVAEILDKYSNIISYREWGVHLGLRSYELFSSKASKGNALIYLRDYLNIEEECVIGFGDDLNDIDLLKKCYVSVAMVNSKSALFNYAKHTTKYSNRKNGVVRFLKKYLKENGK